jgi:hypothetical protein
MPIECSKKKKTCSTYFLYSKQDEGPNILPSSLPQRFTPYQICLHQKDLLMQENGLPSLNPLKPSGHYMYHMI